MGKVCQPNIDILATEPYHFLKCSGMLAWRIEQKNKDCDCNCDSRVVEECGCIFLLACDYYCCVFVAFVNFADDCESEERGRQKSVRQQSTVTGGRGECWCQIDWMNLAFSDVIRFFAYNSTFFNSIVSLFMFWSLRGVFWSGQPSWMNFLRNQSSSPYPHRSLVRLSSFQFEDL